MRNPNFPKYSALVVQRITIRPPQYVNVLVVLDSKFLVSILRLLLCIQKLTH